MNAPEQLAGAYLRLNGFFLLPNFTVFDADHHTDIDLLVIRAPGAEERVGRLVLPQDDKLNLALNQSSQFIALVTQVRGNTNRAFPQSNHVSYAKSLVGEDTEVVPARFSTHETEPERSSDGLTIGLPYALSWIHTRIDWMLHKDQNMKLTKTGSWSWSEPFLQSLLFARVCRSGGPHQVLDQVLADIENARQERADG